ncbi:putative N-acetylmannosaminyltransferase [Marinobacterium sp. xm-a-121]|uniref:WecB/TagA/CpsF family glycosyltransferase n=1 Tax=unclassified Marinobacterium TaxID=2644139 RepID=UPI001569F769|nr:MULTISPECIES: WecB/TagA/CpsF family glycosyltransferase [unclassified Marinobacterium]NRP39425.1 putative N-acetylmannosaminyltransferase [Marinobacterium sp. xm-a-121]NRQ00226.1 putative N-acetylmannosaminyltransferase [Marinobacterium sp. xm-v-233]
MTREEAIARDLKRNVWTVMGLPFDCTTEQETTDHLIDAMLKEERCFFTTPNLNFAITAQNDSQFRDSVINSDWVVADGMPLIWIAKTLGIPLPERVAGSSVFERVRQEYKNPDRPIRVVFFGGPDGTAAEAFKKIAVDNSSMEVVGFYSPGFGSMDEMSDPEVIKQINQTDADLLIVALGAKRGQQWIELNRHELEVPVISHLGAVINFVAGTVNRAPLWIQRSGLEWLWRIWEETSLFKRYWHDGKAFLKYYFNNIRPYKRLIAKQNKRPIHTIDTKFDQSTCTLSIIGDARFNQLDKLRQQLIELVTEQRITTIDFSGVEMFDSSFTGLLQLLNKHVTAYASEGLKLQNLSTEHQDLLKYLSLGDRF